jgi:hypothetical protein
MECVPGSVEEALFTWAMFGATSTVSMVMSRYIVFREASRAGAKGMATTKNSMPRFNSLVISFIVYMMVLACVTLVLVTVLVYVALEALHLGIQGLFRAGDLWNNVYHVQRMLFAFDKFLRPGLFVGYIAARHWKMHAAILACSILCGGIHSMLFIHITFRDKGRQEKAEAEEKKRADQAEKNKDKDDKVSRILALFEEDEVDEEEEQDDDPATKAAKQEEREQKAANVSSGLGALFGSEEDEQNPDPSDKNEKEEAKVSGFMSLFSSGREQNGSGSENANDQEKSSKIIDILAEKDDEIQKRKKKEKQEKLEKERRQPTYFEMRSDTLMRALGNALDTTLLTFILMYGTLVIRELALVMLKQRLSGVE